MKKLLLVAVMFALAASVVMGMGSQSTATSDKDANSPYSIKVLVAPTKMSNYMDTVVGKVIYDKFKINFETISYAGDIREKQSLMLAAGDFGEIQYMQR